MIDWLRRLWRKPQDAEDDGGRAYLYRMMQREADLRESGWLPFYNPRRDAPLPFGKVVDIINDKDEVVTVEYDKIPPWWNVAGKLWRPTKFMELGRTIDGSLAPTPSSDPQRIG